MNKTEEEFYTIEKEINSLMKSMKDTRDIMERVIKSTLEISDSIHSFQLQVKKLQRHQWRVKKMQWMPMSR